MASNKTLEQLLKQDTISNGDVRYMSDHVKQQIIDLTPSCSGPIREKIFWLQHAIQDYPECVTCETKLNTKHFQTNCKGGRYNLHCSVKCAKRDPNGQMQLKLSNQAKYGVDHFLSSAIARQKIEQTNLMLYGTKTPAPWGSSKYKESLIKKYGTDNTREIAEINNKIIRGQIQTNIDSGATESSILMCQARRNVECQSLNLAFDPNRNTLDTVQLEWLHHICNKQYTSPIVDGNIKVCPHCHSGASMLELSLRSLIMGLIPNEEIKFNHRGVLSRNQEYDIYIPNRKIAFEFNGIYWHSALRDPNRIKHLQKTEESENKGIKLIHIWEHDFIHRLDIVESMIRNAFNLSKRINARSCEVQVIDNKLAKKFTNENHIDQSIGGKIHLGLIHNNELVSLMSFGGRRFKKDNCWEIYRFCSKRGFQIQGGGSKLFKYFTINYPIDKVLTFADRSLGGGQVYLNMGMVEQQQTPPSYFWASTRTPESLSRFRTQKHKLANLLPNFDATLSEAENMKRAGWFKIWDCGNRVFTWTRDN